jgi:FlaA1/EpsC-like NDP-sugar epimerase
MLDYVLHQAAMQEKHNLIDDNPTEMWSKNIQGHSNMAVRVRMTARVSVSKGKVVPVL